MPSSEPTFNLKAVIRETGIKPDTLRAWERRYGLPKPRRTPGGHRLYTQRDIDMIRWFMARQREGLSISRAVALWKQLEAEGVDPLTHPEYGLPSAISGAIPEIRPGHAAERLRRAWVQACLALDEEGADAILVQAFTVLPAEIACVEIVQSGLQEIGEGWYRGQVSVQQEHFASALAMRRLDVMLAATPPPTRSGRVLLACPPEEEHVLSSMMLNLFLRRRGWRTTFLGANVPLERMAQTVENARPDLVVLSAQQLFTAETLQRMAQALDTQKVTVAYGGRIFSLHPSLRERITGHFLGDTLEQAVARVEELLVRGQPNPPGQAPSQAYMRLWQDFQRRQAQIHAWVMERMAAAPVSPEHLMVALRFFSRDLSAALALGDLDLLRSELEWVEPLLVHHGEDGGRLAYFLDAYRQAVAAILPGPDAAPLHAWLEKALARA